MKPVENKTKKIINAAASFVKLNTVLNVELQTIISKQLGTKQKYTCLSSYQLKCRRWVAFKINSDGIMYPQSQPRTL